MDYQINNNATIEVLPESNLVEILGNVYNPGLVQYKEVFKRLYTSLWRIQRRYSQKKCMLKELMVR